MNLYRVSPADRVPTLEERRIRRALRTRRFYGIVTLVAFVFAAINSADGDRLQSPAALLIMATLLMYLISAAWVWSVRHRY